MPIVQPPRDLSPLPPVGTTLIAGFESTYLPAYGVDAVDVTGHDARWQEDLAQLSAAGVKHLRYPLRWQQIEPEPGHFDWAKTDAVLGQLQDSGAVPIVDLVHHTSYPDWLQDGFRGADFGPAMVRYAEAVATRYPWLPAYTLFNEPFATLFLAGHEGLWQPYDRGVEGFVRLLKSVLPALTESARCWRDLLPAAHHVWVDTAEHHAGYGAGAEHARMANDRRHVVLDLCLGHDLDPERPFVRELVAAGGESLLGLEPLQVDVLGLDYYCHSEWLYDGVAAHAPSPKPTGLAGVIQQYADRYDLPLMLTETNLRGLPTDQVSWLRYVLEQCELAIAQGVDLHGLCWFPQVDSCDWDSLLARCDGRIDPVGVYALKPDGSRARTALTEAWEAVARGATADDLPAYRFQPPCDAQLAALATRLSHWPWQEPDDHQVVPPVVVQAPRPERTPSTDSPDLVVLSHLRWPWVWQRPQHLVSRLAAQRAAQGARTYFVEEPAPGPVTTPRLRTAEANGVTRVWLVVPPRRDDGDYIMFNDDRARDYGDMVAALLREHGRPTGPDIWMYTPMAFDLVQRIGAGRLVYDVMDDLASFKDAPEGLVLRQRRLLSEADVVFTGGRSLHRAVTTQRRHDVHLFPSGVETAHYARSRALRTPRERKVAGYVGVIDERLDLELLADLARHLPDWTIRLVGPVAKIDPGALPRAANIEYTGQTSYDRLPEAMAGFDVALMPFALNDATRSISPTKTLEYLAAGLPVVSTRVPDVVADYARVVHLADDGAAFAAACRQVVDHPREERDRRARPIQAKQEWDAIAARMADLLAAVPSRPADHVVDLRKAKATVVSA